MKDKEIKLEIAKECSSAVWNVCAKHKGFNSDICPIGANGLADEVLNFVLQKLK